MAEGRLDDLRIYNRRLSPQDMARSQFITRWRRWRASLPSADKEQTGRLRDYFLSNVVPRSLPLSLHRAEGTPRQKEALDNSITTVMVMERSRKAARNPRAGPRRLPTTRRQSRTPDVPAAWPPLPAGAPRNRLTLAKWLVDPAHPLTARVAVNRYWQMYFGTGIVKTSEDFGSQGEPPSHPELLDWLATEFVRTGWDVKAMQRLIVTSSTYRQSSRVTPELHERDPENRLLARGPRFRLPAEMVRDNALAVSGLLNAQHRRAQRVAVSARRTLGRDCLRRRLHLADLRPGSRRPALPPRYVHVLEAYGAARHAEHLRRPRSRKVHCPRGPSPTRRYRRWRYSTTRRSLKRRAPWLNVFSQICRRLPRTHASGARSSWPRPGRQCPKRWQVLRATLDSSSSTPTPTIPTRRRNSRSRRVARWTPNSTPAELAAWTNVCP